MTRIGLLTQTLDRVASHTHTPNSLDLRDEDLTEISNIAVKHKFKVLFSKIIGKETDQLIVKFQDENGNMEATCMSRTDVDKFKAAIRKAKIRDL